MKILISGIALALGLSLLAGCNSAQSTQQISRPAEAAVTLDIFSGRPNPTWPLDESQLEMFALMLESLPEGLAVPRNEQLGYRGLELRSSQGDTQTIYWVYSGVVKTANATGTSSYYEDRNMQVALFLLEAGKPHIPEDLYNLVNDTLRP